MSNYNTPVNFQNLVGRRFGRLTVVSRAANKGASVCWNCLCDCGKKKVIRSNDLKSGKSLSCGCLGASHRIAASSVHKGTGTRLYRIWKNMKTRTTNPKAQYYYLYGGRGIKVCDEWINNFQAFQCWALSHGYRDDLTIDRIDNDGNYEPGNCRWATAKQQQENKRKWGSAKNA